MARTARASVGGVCHHVLNRGNGRAAVFHKKEDYVAFLDLMEEAQRRLPMRLLACCLIPNHLAVVFGGRAEWRKARGAVSSRPASARQRLARLGESAARRSGIGGAREVHRTRNALWKGVVATRHRRAFGFGSKTSPSRSPANSRDKVECSLCASPFVRPPRRWR
jgi:hypothetical protein